MNTKKVIGSSLAAIIILITGQILAQFLASACVGLKIPAAICNTIAGVLYVGITYILLRLFFEKIMKRSVSDWGIGKFCIKLRWIMVAIVLPLGVELIYLLGLKGEYVSSDMNTENIMNTLSAGIMFSGIAAGFVEEMVFRGIILNVLKERWNIYVAVVIPSLLFGFLHIPGMKYSIGSSLLVILAGTMVGIMFSLIAIESGSVWNSGIVHAVWNILIIGGGLSIGEKADQYSVITYVLESGSFANTGGEFGIEASVVSLMGYIVVAVISFIMILGKNKSVTR